METNITIDELNAMIANTTEQILDHEITGTTTRKVTIDVRQEHLHLIPVLEAIASLAVSQADTQVVAVSVIVSTTELKFTVAENTEVSKDVLGHVRELLALLKTYSSADEAAQAGAKLAIVKMTYRHSYYKLKKRFRNRIDEKLEIAFTDAMGRYEGSALVTGAREVVSALTTMYELLRQMRKWAGTIKPTKPKGRDSIFDQLDPLWEPLIAEMDDVTIDLEDVLDNEDKCKQWADKLKGVGADPEKSIALYRWIQKISSHHRHINALLRYALSDKGRQELANVDAPDCLNSAVGNIPAKVDVGTVHCECSLIVNLEKQMLQTDPPLNYIGVSKLSCAPCYAWVQAYNAAHDIKFYTQGTHGRWYKKWVMSPALENQTMFRKIKEIVELAAKTHAKAGTDERRQIALSDSTGSAKWHPQQHRTNVYHSAVSRTAREERQQNPEPKK